MAARGARAAAGNAVVGFLHSASAAAYTGLVAVFRTERHRASIARLRSRRRETDLARLRSRSCIIDGDAVACDETGVPSFERIRPPRRHLGNI
jgi:hypothetical protein